MADADGISTVRLLIADLGTGDAQLLTDDQIGTLLDLEDGSIKLGAADCLDAIAVSEVLVSKKITTQDLSTDGPAVAAELRARAAALRQQAAADDDSFDCGVAEFDTGYTDIEAIGRCGSGDL